MGRITKLKNKMEENKVIKVSLNSCQSSPEQSQLFVDVSRSMPNFSEENLEMKNNEKFPQSESASSNGSDGGKDNSQRKKVLSSDTLLDSANRIKSFFFDENIFKGTSEEFLKTKVLGFWHSMKYGWASSMRTNFSKDTPICMFGKAYHGTFTFDNHECSNIDGFKRDFQTVIWFTYRQKFPLLNGTNLTSDCGWGCMIRSGQMLIAEALKRHLFPKGWTYSLNNTIDDVEKHKKLITWFNDFPSPNCPFSIHNLVQLGNKLNKQAGNWYGPSCICHIFKDAFKEYAISIPDLENISVIISQDGGVYLQDIIEECFSNCCICPEEMACEALTKERLSEDIKVGHSSELPTSASSFECSERANTNSVTHMLPSTVTNNHSCVQETEKSPISFKTLCTRMKQNECPNCEHWRPSVILVPVRLGRSSVNSLYYQCIFSLLLHDLCIGIIGGRPKHSLYFVGFQDKHLIHIDPHLIQDTTALETADLASFHCSVPRKMSISKMDPSAAVGFFCPTKNDFIRLVKEIPQLVSVKEGNLESSLFEFIDAKSSLHQLELEDFTCDTVDLSSLVGCSSEDEELVC